MEKYVPEVKIKHSTGGEKFIIVECDASERGRIRKETNGKFKMLNNNEKYEIFDSLEEAFCWLVPNFCDAAPL